MKCFAERLKQLREEKKKKDSKWIQNYVADLLGVARPTYTAYENGTKQPPLDTINKIADIFNVSSDYLLCRTDKPNYEDIEEALNDPDLGIWFKNIQDASHDKREELKQFWEFIIQKEKGRKPGDKQNKNY